MNKKETPAVGVMIILISAVMTCCGQLCWKLSGSGAHALLFLLAGACLAKTCIGYGGYSSVTIQSGDRELTLKNDDLLFRDNSATLNSSKEEKEP